MRVEAVWQEAVQEIHRQRHEQIDEIAGEDRAEDGFPILQRTRADVLPGCAAQMERQDEKEQHETVLQPESAHKTPGCGFCKHRKKLAQQLLQPASDKGAANINNDEVQWLDGIFFLGHDDSFPSERSNVEDQNGDHGIIKESENVGGSGDECRRRNGGVDVELFQRQRHNGAEQRGHEIVQEQRDADGDTELHAVLPERSHETDDDAERKPESAAEKGFAQNGFDCFFRHDITGGDTADGNGAGLCADITGDTGHHRDEDDERGNLLQGELEMIEHHTGADAPENGDEQPRQTGRKRGDDAGALFHFGFCGTGHTINVLAGLILNDVDDIVDGDDAEDVFFVVDDRQREKAVAGHDVGDFFLVVAHIDAGDVLAHDVADEGFRPGDDELTQGKDPDEMVEPVDDVDVVNGFGVWRIEPDDLDGFFGVDENRHDNEFGGHQTTGAVAVVGQQVGNIIDGFVFEE